ncbi:hypothetical protein CKAH01_07377 [Colletotrichum kahawae]|uniref:Uncharacterized protein n=1 Tax=Colletotrichum kahawae TaxID=34407 RepID=A0AAE0D3B8_COLKA|nr:hypothetical protein CKAH01_07377 [Colletotrichum kahawae]
MQSITRVRKTLYSCSQTSHLAMLCVMVTREAFPKVAETFDGVLPRKAVKQPNKQAPSSGHQTKGKGAAYLLARSKLWAGTAAA